MNGNDVNIKVPPEADKSSIIQVTGAPANVEKAKIALQNRVKELEDEKADKQLKSFEVKLEVKPEYHPKLIGREGKVIKQLRTDFDVMIQLPKKNDSSDDSTIIITGYEKNANQAKDAILKIINEFVSFTFFATAVCFAFSKWWQKYLLLEWVDDIKTWYHQYHTDKNKLEFTFEDVFTYDGFQSFFFHIFRRASSRMKFPLTQEFIGWLSDVVVLEFAQ